MSFVLYGSGFTAEHREATRATPLPAEIPKPGGVCGELFPCSLCSRSWCCSSQGQRFCAMTQCEQAARQGVSENTVLQLHPALQREGLAVFHLPTTQKHPPGRVTFPGRRTKPFHEHCTELRDNWRAGFAQAVPEGLGHFSLLHISIPGTATANNWWQGQ